MMLYMYGVHVHLFRIRACTNFCHDCTCTCTSFEIRTCTALAIEIGFLYGVRVQNEKMHISYTYTVQRLALALEHICVLYKISCENFPM